MKLRRNSSGLITASLIVYQILCNFKANTSTELAVTLAWHSAADAFILSTLLLHPSANITPANAHLPYLEVASTATAELSVAATEA